MKFLIYLLPAVLLFSSCKNHEHDHQHQHRNGDHDGEHKSHYHDNTGRDDVLTGGVKMIPIETSEGTFNVWTKRVGNNPKMKLLLVHGGPGATHEYFESFDSYFPNAEIEY